MGIKKPGWSRVPTGEKNESIPYPVVYYSRITFQSREVRSTNSLNPASHAACQATWSSGFNASVIYIPGFSYLWGTCCCPFIRPLGVAPLCASGIWPFIRPPGI